MKHTHEVMKRTLYYIIKFILLKTITIFTRNRFSFNRNYLQYLHFTHLSITSKK